MPLLDLLKHDKSVLDGYTIQQIVSICGDGKLKDGSKTSDELRGFLASRPPLALAEYANYCLEGNFEKGEKSGFVLQDIVNEIGRRLGYTVTNGLYQGRTNAIGFDGLWSDGENALLIEVKTSDAYRINLDTIFGYGQKLDRVIDGADKKRCSLIVVGRQDTGDLEAQVRGSRYAWTVRMVSVEALTKLMFVNAELEDQALTAKIRKVLMPFEYTRVDHIIDLVFETQQEADSNAELEAQHATEGVDTATSASDQPTKSIKRELSPTPREALDAKRFAAVSAFFSSRSLRFSRKSKTNFASDDDKVRVACAVSKRYELDFNNDAVLTSARPDRLLHYAETVRIEGKSYRSKDQVEV